MKKTLAILLTLLLTVAMFAGCGKTAPAPAPAPAAEPAAEAAEPAAEPEAAVPEAAAPAAITGSYTIRLGTPTGGKHQQNVTMEEFKTRIEAASNGAITVELYPTSQLGTAAQMIEGVQNGTIEGVLIPSSYFVSYAPATAIIDLPFLFDTVGDGSASEKAYQVLNSGTSLDNYLYEHGFKVGGYLLCANRYLLTTFPIKTMSDLNGKNIWSLPSIVLQNEIKSYGASPVTLDPGDIAVGLQNGTVDGVANDATFWFTQSLFESAKCKNMVPGSAMTNCFFFSADWYDTLPAEVQELVISTTQACITEVEYEYMQTFVDMAESKMMAEGGLEVIEASDELVAEMKAATAPLHDSFKATDADCAAIYDEFAAAIAALG